MATPVGDANIIHGAASSGRLNAERVIRKVSAVALFLVAIGAAVPATAADPSCLLLVEAADGTVLSRQGDRCEAPATPASTFKIPLALMGFDAGILETPESPAWPYSPDYPAWREQWKRTTTPSSWLADSVVWYSQVLTQRLGMARFQAYVDGFGYGNRDLSGDPGRNNGLTRSWLSSSLTITPVAQVAFLRRLVRGELPVSAQAVANTADSLTRFDFAAGDGQGGWQVYGKTGNGFQLRPDGTPDTDRQVGWFVGWASRGDRTVIFAKLIEDTAKSETPASFRSRDALLQELPRLLDPPHSSE